MLLAGDKRPPRSVELLQDAASTIFATQLT